jgi:hypothetical protein
VCGEQYVGVLGDGVLERLLVLVDERGQTRLVVALRGENLSHYVLPHLCTGAATTHAHAQVSRIIVRT